METASQSIGWATAAVAGVLSFLSPCVLPLVPGYLSYISGATVEDLQKGLPMRRLLTDVGLNSLWFVMGFTLVFVTLGASATVAGQFLMRNSRWMMQAAGAVVIVFGLHLLGVFKIGFLHRYKTLQVKAKPTGPLGAAFIGVAFSLGWTPCIGPILTGILAIAASQSTVQQGVALLTVYSLGLGIPFIITALLTGAFFKFYKGFRRHLGKVEKFSGAMLVVMGILLVTEKMTLITARLSSF